MRWRRVLAVWCGLACCNVLGCGSPEATGREAAGDDTTATAASSITAAGSSEEYATGRDDSGGASDDDASSTTRSDAGDESSTEGEPLLGPPYPIVFCHGFFGFEDFAGAAFVNYFWGIKTDLAARGELEIFTPAVDPFNDSNVRGLALLEHVETIVATTGHAKVNLVGHSQGGLDARVVAHLRPDLVASVTTISTPHGGSLVADISLGLVPSLYAQALIDAMVVLAGAPLWSAIGDDTSLAASLGQFSSKGIAAFNETYPDAPNIPYYSIGGRSRLHLGGSDCAVSDAPDFIRDFAAERDPIDPLFALPAQILSGSLLDPQPNDGLVTVQSAKWGQFLGCIPADHIDQIGHMFGDGAGFGNDWDHVDFYAGLVEFLRRQGF